MMKYETSSFDYNHNFKSYHQWISNKENWIHSKLDRNSQKLTLCSVDKVWSKLLPAVDVLYIGFLRYMWYDFSNTIPNSTVQHKRAVIHISLKGLPRLGWANKDSIHIILFRFHQTEFSFTEWKLYLTNFLISTEGPCVMWLLGLGKSNISQNLH